jgi:hypothetical protein
MEHINAHGARIDDPKNAIWKALVLRREGDLILWFSRRPTPLLWHNGRIRSARKPSSLGYLSQWLAECDISPQRTYC